MSYDGEHTGAGPRVAVVIPTRDRGEAVLRAVRSVLAGSFTAFELVVVDQSDDPRTQTALATIDDARVVYRRDPRRGLSHALNCGVAATAAELIAITGDDCEVAPDWLARVVAAFAETPAAGIVFGSVHPGAHDAGRGFVQAYTGGARVLARDLRDKRGLGGTSACMALRRATFDRLHGFDAQLGVGAPLRAAEETDLALRALAAGVAVLEDPRVRVTHHGFLEWRHLPELVARNWFGTGAAFGKLLKRRPLDTLVVLAGLGRRWLAPADGVAATLGDGATRSRRLLSFARGILAGLARPVDARTQHFRGPAARDP